MNTHTGTTETGAVPRWSLASIYSGLTGDDYASDKSRFSGLLTKLDSLTGDIAFASREPYAWLRKSLELLNEISALYGTLGTYVYASFSVDTQNELCVRELNKIEELSVPFQPAFTRFRLTLSSQAAAFAPGVLPKEFEAYWFFIEENLKLATHQMSPEEESLAADLSRSGSEAFTRLQESLSSSIKRPWNTATLETKTMVELRGMAHDPDRDVRRRAYDIELAAWKEFRVPFAASLNGVKGTAITLAKRRNWKKPIDQSVEQARISAKTLDSLIDSMRAALPDFRRYMKAKADLLGVDKLAFYDLFAPLAGLSKEWSFTETRDYIVTRFGSFSKDLADFAAMAFDKQWIDAEPRAGKVGGAYCIDFSLRNECRIMSNFTGTFDSVITLAHELGHAWHSWLLRDTPYLLREYPMTLAETASLFCETLVYADELKAAKGREKLALLEMRLSDINQIITDILSRFIFESAVFDRRENGELSAEEFCELMLDAQDQTYGEGLDKDLRHQYMWAVKNHYYHAGLNFYNYPYAFGQLFGMGLYKSFQKTPQGFQDRYATLLRRTGSIDAVRLCKEQGIDIETRSFWDSALDLVRADIDLFCSIAESSRST